jgi:hypothetical protein
MAGGKRHWAAHAFAHFSVRNLGAWMSEAGEWLQETGESQVIACLNNMWWC